MATLGDRFHLNVPGPFYNDTSCIDCGLCPEIAPQIFRRDPNEGQTYVWRQPASEAEEALAREAAESCPTESIGADGPLTAPDAAADLPSARSPAVP